MSQRILFCAISYTNKTAPKVTKMYTQLEANAQLLLSMPNATLVQTTASRPHAALQFAFAALGALWH